MRGIHRPIHSGFETLRHRRDPRSREMQFNRNGSPACEQMTALGFALDRRRQALFEQGCSR